MTDGGRTADRCRTDFPARRRMDGGGARTAVLSRSGEGEPSTNGGTNQRMQTADGGRQTAVGWAFQPVRGGADRQRMGERINECGSRTADRRRTGFPACQGGADCQRMGERINEWRPRTVEGGIEAGLDGWFRVSRKDERQGAKTDTLLPPSFLSPHGIIFLKFGNGGFDGLVQLCAGSFPAP
jgi:hypothetical protein